MKEEIQKTLDVLRAGGVILYPTDTIWGLGCDATRPEAVEKIFRIKKREESKSLIVLLDREELLNKYVKEVPAMAWDLVELSEKPLTIIYDNACNLAPNVIAPDGSAGIRVTRDEFCRQLIFKLGKPLVSTSANISGEASPATFADISPQIRNEVDYVVQWRQQEQSAGKASSIIRLGKNGEVAVIRK